MKFILGYVTCCMTSTPCNNNNKNKEGSSTSRKTEDETRSLVTTTTPAIISRRRKRTLTRGSSVDWQPSLLAIAEDNNGIAIVTPKKVEVKVNQKIGVSDKQRVPQRNVKQCGVSSGRVNGRHSSSSSYGISRETISMVMPTFSAAPFMF